MGAQAARIGARLHAEIAHACKMLTLEIARELKRTTPIDTGHARRNWIATVGQPNTVEIEGEGGGRDKRGRFLSGGEEAAAGVAAVMAYTLTSGPLWVANVVPYIRRLNAGTSQQAPAAFVEIAIDRAMTTVRQKLAAKGSAVDFGPIQDQFRAELAGDAAGNVASAYSPFGDD